MKEIEDLRKEVDKADDELVSAFLKRLAATDKIGEVKRAGGMCVEDFSREKIVLDRLLSSKTPSQKEAITDLYAAVFKISKQRQAKDER